MKKFFIQMEEKFVFPIGRRTWQILALISLLVLGSFIFWFIINATPSTRKEVSVSKDEVVNNKIDTVNIVKSEAESPECLPKDYALYIDSLKQDLPKAEWKNLGSYSEPYQVYVEDEYGYYVYDDNGNAVTKEQRDYIRNYEAIPNRLDDLYSANGIDSLQICKKINLLKTLHYLHKLSDSKYFQEEGFDYYYNVLYNDKEIDSYLLQNTEGFLNKINEEKLKIKDQNAAESFFKYVMLFSRNSISEEEIKLCSSFLQEHQKIKNPYYKKDQYYNILETIIQSNLETKELEKALTDFSKDMDYYDRHELDKSLSRYLGLYNNKLNLAEQDKKEKEIKKAINRNFSLMAIGASFLSVLLIATILLLYSIQHLLKNINKN